MIGTSRSYEHRGYAVDRTHLMPVVPCERVEHPLVSLLLWVAIIASGIALAALS